MQGPYAMPNAVPYHEVQEGKTEILDKETDARSNHFSMPLNNHSSSSSSSSLSTFFLVAAFFLGFASLTAFLLT